MRRLFCLLAALSACADAPAPTDLPADAPPLADGEVATPAGSGSLAPRLIAGSDGAPVLSWVEPKGDGHALRTARWTGRGWGAATTADRGDRWFVNWADTPGVAATPSGLVAHTLPMHPGGDSPYAYDAAIRMPDGARRLLHDDGAAAEHGFVSTAPLPDGRVGAVWLDGRNQGGGHGHDGGAMTLRYAALGADGRLSDEAALDVRTCDCCPTALVATPSGLVAAYRDRSQTEVRDVAVVRRVDGAWTEPAIPHADGWTIAGCPVNGPALAARGDRVALAWFTGAEPARVQVALSDDGGATWADAVRVDGGAPLGRVGVAMLDDGRAVVSWLEPADDETAAFRVRTLGTDGALGAAQTVATVAAGRASGIPRVAAVGRRALVAWTDAEASTVRSALVPL